MIISIIVAFATGGIGFEGSIPWRLRRDMLRFKALTTGHPIIMGRKTFESLPKVLPKRTNVVISRNPDYEPAEGCKKASTPEEALEIAQNSPGSSEIFIIGGEKIYEAFGDKADRIYVTDVDYDGELDARFSYEIFSKFFSLTSRSTLDFPEDEKNDCESSFHLHLRRDKYPVHPDERWKNEHGIYRVIALSSHDGSDSFDYIVFQNEGTGFVSFMPMVKFANSMEKLQPLLYEVERP